MRTNRHDLALTVALAAPFGGTLLPSQAPQYRIELLGPGTLINDMNEAGEVVGWVSAGGVQAFVVGPDHAHEILPLPTGYSSAWAQGINDHGVIVGSAATGNFPEFGQAVAWLPDGQGGYSVQFLGQLPGHTSSVAYDVNNRGDIVGVSIIPGFQGGPTVWFNSPSGVMNLGALGAPSSPKQINDEGVVVGISGGLFDIDTLQASPLPPLPTGWSGFQGWAINDYGDLAGKGLHGSQISAAIWTAGGGWQSVSSRFGQSALVQAFDIDDQGLVTFATPAPALWVPGVGSSSMTALLPPSEQTNWTFSASLGSAVNDSGQIAVLATHVPSNTVGVALLTPMNCQDDLGAQGPGTANATFCGAGLAGGQSSDYVVTGAPGTSVGLLAVSFAGHPDTPAFGGTLVSFGGYLYYLPLFTDAVGEARRPFAGIAAPGVNLVLQSVFLEPSLPQGLAFSNAVLGRLGQ
ncbi:MAG: hypothetical protein KDC98_22110 [Planctomycetes bacterium]|nr:hypothetical protein [Planctomycetota bacterium]